MGIPRQECWNGLLFPPPGALAELRTECVSCIGRSVLYHWDTWENSYSLIFCVYNWDCVIWPHLHSLGLGVSSERTVVVQSLSHVWLFVTPWTAAHQASLTITISQSMPKFMSNESMMPSNHLLLCRPLLLLPSIFPSIRVFSNDSAIHIRWPKHWSFSFSIRPSNEYSGLVSFRIDCFDLLAFQGTLKSLLQHHSLKASLLQHSTFFIVQL